ncbi:TAP-like protein-domain-containing protein [Cadophora sp. MPI-SDFR-AT-0126]|nr:TAP-like protein-domain-containing protein [Leotiomycetes sp. MPI-SDFR-AT-0126]
MKIKTGFPYREGRRRHDACDQCEPPTMRDNLRAQRWQFWIGGFLKALGILTLILALRSIIGWQFGLTVYYLRLWTGVSEVKSGVVGWKWGEIQPSKDIVWYQCYEQYDCARLEAPLDWLDPSNPRRATIAIIRYNATDRENYNGPVFINPGGPGGSGAWFVKRLGPYYQHVVGTNHDIISFDPRGVGATTPQISCWNASSAKTSSLLWDLQEPPVLDAHPGAIYDSYAHATAFSQQCMTQMGDTARFVSTPAVARDMLHIMERLGESKLKYWGFSYGTFLGTTFATLFPDKVGRMVNDGNVDARDYVSGAPTHFLQDTDNVMDSFYRFCHLAGPKQCAFHATTPEAIEARLQTLLKRIKTHPIIVPASTSLNPRPEIVSYSKLQRLITSALYRPLVMFPSLADTFVALEAGDGRPFIDLTSQGGEELPLCDSRLENPADPENPTPEVPEAEGSVDASKAIMCSDGEPIPGGVEEFSVYAGKLMDLSKSAGSSMVSMVLGCVGWKVRGRWQFTGPFEGNTSHPILFIANTADNVTPLRSALANAEGFPGSVVMIQDSYGHTTLSCPSRCTARTIRSYFQNGTLPANGTICLADLVPFEPWKLNSGAASLSSGSEDERLYFALRELMMAPVLEF